MFDLLDFSTYAGVIAISAILRSYTGFGFALAAVPLLSLVTSAQSAVLIVTLIQFFFGFHDMISLRKDIDTRSLKWMLPGTVLGIPLGVYLLQYLDPDIIRIVIAVLVFIAAFSLLIPPKSPSRKKAPGIATIYGFFSGAFSGLVAMPGPPAVIYFLSSGFEARTSRATMLIFFFVCSSLSAIMYLIAGFFDFETVLKAVLLLPIVYLGNLLGSRLFQNTSNARHRLTSILVLFGVAIAAGLNGLAGL